jgi:hypothetical protein
MEIDFVAKIPAGNVLFCPKLGAVKGQKRSNNPKNRGVSRVR